MDFTVPRVGKPNLEHARKWHGLIAVEGRRTMDGRLVMPLALNWTEAPFPIPLIEDDQIVGSVDSIRMIEHDDHTVLIEGRGRVVKHITNRGLAVSIDHVKVEIEEVAPTSAEAAPINRTAPATIQVLFGRVRQVVLTDRPAWPVCILDFDDETPEVTDGRR